MRSIKLFTLAVLAFLFSQCKVTAPTDTAGSSSLVTEVFKILDITENRFLHFGDSTNGNPWKAIMRTADWLQTQANVQSVETLDSIYIRVTLKSGLKAMFHFDETDANGKTLFRGGGHSNGKNDMSLEPSPHLLSTNTIKNKKVLIFSPPYYEFYANNNEMQKVLDLLHSSSLNLNVTLLKNEECSFDVVNTFGDYGLVILDTHGKPDGFMVGGVDTTSDTTQWLAGLTQDQLKSLADTHAGEGSYNKILSGDITLEMSVKVNPTHFQWSKVQHMYKFITFMLNSRYLATIPDLSKTVVFGNMCYSGWNFIGHKNSYFVDDPIRAAFLAKHPISYYCYHFGDPNSDLSRTVYDDFAHVMEDSLLSGLVTNRDSTGQVYLEPNGTKYYDNFAPANYTKLFFNHYGADDYSYALCGDDLLDTRDGQIYKTVCIGKQVWMAQNLNYNVAGSHCPYDDGSLCAKYGRSYDWKTVLAGSDTTTKIPSGVQGICPKGWHIPSPGEFDQLVTFLGGPSLAGGKMKDTVLWDSPNAGATNSSGFSALPAGLWTGTPNNQYAFGRQAYFLTTAQNQGLPIQYLLDTAGPVLNWYGGTYGSNFASCRCVKDP
ncbi:MAG: FISUMP domain-containing protein [bacterium]